MDSNSLNLDMKVQFSTRVIIEDPDSGETFVDKSNAIHSQNMARAIARGLANEPNSTFYRMAFGNGGSFIDAGENIQLNPPNDGTRGEGWESRLYNETYSEVIQNLIRDQSMPLIVPNTNPALGQDEGSSGPEGVRIGGGSMPVDDDPSNSVISVEVGRRSNIIATVTINRNEPVTQLPAITGEDTIDLNTEADFNFDELGIYTEGKGASPSAAYARINVGTATANTPLPSSMLGQTYNLTLDIDGTPIIVNNIQIPTVAPSATPRPVTYGDLCQIINSLADPEEISLSITNTNVTEYPSLGLVQTFGFLIIRNEKSVGASSTINVTCNNLLSDLLGGGCTPNDIQNFNGEDAGVLNSRSSPWTERERLLTHITFPPILKKANRQIRVRYILTVSVAQVGDTRIDFPPVVDLANGA